ncbi:TRAP transporter substrate-binding protein DctP [Marinobacterium nitratireducens]
MNLNQVKKKASAVAISLACLMQTPAFAGDKISWTMTTTWPDSLELVEVDRHWVKLVEQIAGDDIDIKFYPGGTLMPGNEVFDAVENGSIDASGDWPGYWAGRDPAFSPLASHVSLFNAVDYLNWIYEWGGFEFYEKLYGKYGIVYLPYGVANSESGFRGQKRIANLDELNGKRIRLSGREQGKVLEKLGASQVTIAGGELYQAIERGVVDAGEFSMPGVDYKAGFGEVSKYWASPGWHQTASVYGLMVNKESWDALPENVRTKLKVAAQANMTWSLTWTERRSTEGAEKFKAKGIEITRYPDEDLKRIQDVANEVMLESSCENKLTAEIYYSQISYLNDYANWRDVSVPFNLSQANHNLPSLDAIKKCI